MNNFNKIINRKKNKERKWSSEYLENNYSIDFSKKIYNLSIADLDFETPKSIVKAIFKRAKRKTYSYTYQEESSILSIINWYNKVHNIFLKKELIKLVHGTVNAMFETVKCFTNINDAVLIQSPIYQPFERSIIKTKRKVIYNRLVYKNNNYFVNFEEFEKQIKENEIKLFLWCNPHNPGGRVWNNEEIEKIIEICNKYKILIFSDEVHGDLTLEKEHNSILKYRNQINNFIVCNSPNKAFNLGGLKGSYMICSNNEIMKKILTQYENDSLTSSNVFFQPALIAAYSNEYSFKWLLKLKKYILSNYLFFKNELKNFDNVKIMEMDASYLLWINLKTQTNWDEIKTIFLKKNMILNFYNEFADCEQGWLRINIAISKKQLKEVTKKFKEIIKNL
ncbi:aminotransferase class I/II-fold pyridoxal phosphate-dependent enzyme [Spiroplasma floricola]|uniref:cysteine-S-conjugate beta-lyase n=1 Tax=Spiroplasma floricola 23-6 TaxID=1336749 RepID=A0A2K8SDM6_9MOLU|nr:aminotransferase class I/II-fold pyridoxal phosphate-dependent enzyme [Spiroplasma floricola]AUB31564.1 cystathione beta-lyase [Spiroplasma floricola 23-6]